MNEDLATPYRAAAHLYWDAGWRGVLPLPAGQKKNPPRGYTGEAGITPSYADIQAWLDGPESAGNICLRLPPDILGIDVDHYGDKRGGDTLADAEKRWGPLPNTVMSSSRDDGISGIRFYRVPANLRWPGELGPDTELIQHRHRYALVWPSLHPEGRQYRWWLTETYTPIDTDWLPMAGSLAALPEAWTAGLTAGELAVNAGRGTYDPVQAAEWLATVTEGQPPCRRMHAALTDALVALNVGSRHAAARQATMRLIRLAVDGHTGIATAALAVRNAFLTACNDPARGSARHPGEAEHEFASLFLGAINLITAGNDTGAVEDPCNPPPIAVTATPRATGLSIPAEAARAVEAATAPPGTAAQLDPLVQQEIIIQRTRRTARRILDNEEADKQFREPTWRANLTAELAIPDEPVTYTIDQLMPTGANVLLTSQYKTGKTTLVNALTQALADKHPFLDRYEVAAIPGRIALFNYEVDERQYRRWLRDLGIENTDKITVLNLRGYRLPLITDHAQDWTVRWLEEHEISVWIIDPFARAFTGSGTSENDNTEVGAFLDTLDVIKKRAGVEDLIMPVHTGRSEVEEGAERARGATRLDDWADVRWLLTKDDAEARYFRATGRDVEVPEGRLDYLPASRRLAFGDGASRAAERVRRISDLLLSVIASHPGISTRKLRDEVRERAGRASNEAIETARSALLRSGRIRYDSPARTGQSGQHFYVPIHEIFPGSES